MKADDERLVRSHRNMMIIIVPLIVRLGKKERLKTGYSIWVEYVNGEKLKSFCSDWSFARQGILTKEKLFDAIAESIDRSLDS